MLTRLNEKPLQIERPVHRPHAVVARPATGLRQTGIALNLRALLDCEDTPLSGNPLESLRAMVAERHA